MTTLTGLVPPQQSTHRAVREVAGAAQSAPGPQIPAAVQAAIGAGHEQGTAPSLAGRVEAQAAPQVQPLIDPEVLDAIQQDALVLLYASEGLSDNDAIVLVAIQLNSNALQFASERLIDKDAIVLAAVHQDGFALQYASERLRADPAIVLAAVGQNGYALQYASERSRADPAIVLAAVHQDVKALMFVNGRLRADPAFLFAAAARNGLILEHIPEALRTIEVAGVAVAQNPAARQWVPEVFLARGRAELDNPALFPFLPEGEITPERSQRAVEVNPLFLRFVPAEIQVALEASIFTLAVRGNPEVLQFVNSVLLKEEVVNTVIQMGQAIPLAPHLLAARNKTLKTLADQVRAGVIDPGIANHWIFGLAQYFQDDKEFMLCAITIHGIDLSVASERLRDDEDVVLASVRVVKSDWGYASERLKANPTPALRAVLELPSEA